MLKATLLGQFRVHLNDQPVQLSSRPAQVLLDIAQLERPATAPNSQSLMAAVSVYKGELLPGFYEDWVLLERERLRGLFESRMHALLDLLTAEDRWAEVQSFSDQWIARPGTGARTRLPRLDVGCHGARRFGQRGGCLSPLCAGTKSRIGRGALV